LTPLDELFNFYGGTGEEFFNNFNAFTDEEERGGNNPL